MKEVAPHSEGSGIRHSPALVAHEDGRHSVMTHDEEGLFEARVEAGQVGEIGTVLTVGVHHDSVEPPLRRPLAETLHSVLVDEVGDDGHRSRHPEIRQLHLGETRPGHEVIGPDPRPRLRRHPVR